MPGAFPAAAPSIAGDLVTISRFLQSPTFIARRLRTFRDLRFVSDQLLTQRLRSQGGAVLYETGETGTTDRTPESVAPGSTYPYANTVPGTASVAAVQKWGQKVLLTDEELIRSVYQGQVLDRQLRKVINTIIGQIDAISMSAITSAVTNTFNVTAAGGIAWNLANATILRDVLRARSQVRKLNMGYEPNVLAINDDTYAYMLSDDKITNALRRETTDSPVYTGEVETLFGLAIIQSPQITTGTAFLIDTNQFGGMADEVDGAPGYAVADLAVQTKAIRHDDNDSWDLQGRRKTVPVVLEPNAAVKFTNIGL
jgi:hypothetical protein